MRTMARRQLCTKYANAETPVRAGNVERNSEKPKKHIMQVATVSLIIHVVTKKQSQTTTNSAFKNV